MISRTRTLLAISLLLLSLLSSFLIATLSSHKSQIWMATHPLPAGHRVITSDFSAAPVGLPRGAASYITTRYSLQGSVTLRAIRQGELLLAGAITSDQARSNLTSIPISIRASDLPANISVGEEVDLVHTGDGEHLVIKPEIIASSVAIVGLERKSANFSGQVTVTIAVNRSRTLPLIAASSIGRIVLVRTHA
jgi:hypothetical protein